MVHLKLIVLSIFGFGITNAYLGLLSESYKRDLDACLKLIADKSIDDNDVKKIQCEEFMVTYFKFLKIDVLHDYLQVSLVSKSKIFEEKGKVQKGHIIRLS